MVTILRLKRQRDALPVDEINCESKKLKLNIDDNLQKSSFYRFISNNVKLLPEILQRIRQSTVIKKPPTFIDVTYEDVTGKVANNEMDWSDANKETDFVYDYYCTEDLEIVKQEIIDLMTSGGYNSDDDRNIYESDEDSNDENYWGNEYIEEKDVILRCPDYEDEDVRDDVSVDSDSLIIKDYGSDYEDREFDYYRSDDSD